MIKTPIAAILGPTGVGKTETAIKIAKHIGGEIISADSMQVYKHMDIGSAKPSISERGGIAHYLLDVAEPNEEFNVCRFVELAKDAVKQITGKGKIPILVGGTGLYADSFLDGIDFKETPRDDTLRTDLERYALENGNNALHEKLKEVDEKSFHSIHANNVRRVIRALEFYYITKTPISANNEATKKIQPPYNTCYIVLNRDRTELYNRIDARVDIMMKNGLLDEVLSLVKMGYSLNNTSMQGLGYKELIYYIKGLSTLGESVAIIKRDSRRYAKRQLTWFKRRCDAIWIDIGDEDSGSIAKRCVSHIENILKTY